MLVLAVLWILRGWWTGGGSASWQSDDASDPTWIDRIAQGSTSGTAWLLAFERGFCEA